MKEKLKWLLPLLACLLVIAGWVFVHRRVIAALIRGEELPEPPEWHVWCRKQSEA